MGGGADGERLTPLGSRLIAIAALRYNYRASPLPHLLIRTCLHLTLSRDTMIHPELTQTDLSNFNSIRSYTVSVLAIQTYTSLLKNKMSFKNSQSLSDYLRIILNL